jgi:hypothetical protein
MDTSSILFDPMEAATATEFQRALPPASSEWWGRVMLPECGSVMGRIFPLGMPTGRAVKR